MYDTRHTRIKESLPQNRKPYMLKKEEVTHTHARTHVVRHTRPTTHQCTHVHTYKLHSKGYLMGRMPMVHH